MKKILKGADRELHLRFKECGANALMWKRKCILMLPEIDDARIWEKKGFGSVHEYAGRLAGLSHHLVTDGLRILRKTANMPHIRMLIEKRGINIIRVMESHITVENEKFWAEKAASMSMHTLAAYIRSLKLSPNTKHRAMLKNPKNPHRQANLIFENAGGQVLNSDQSYAQNVSTQNPDPRVEILMQLKPQTLSRIQKLKGKLSWEEIISQLLDERDEQLEAQKPKAVQTDSRYIPAEIQNFVIKRTNSTCAFPECIKTFDEIHHTLRFSLTREHDPNHLEILCEPHHQLAHHGLIDNEDCPSQNWKIRIEADQNSPKFAVDSLVQKYRSG